MPTLRRPGSKRLEETPIGFETLLDDEPAPIHEDRRAAGAPRFQAHAGSNNPPAANASQTTPTGTPGRGRARTMVQSASAQHPRATTVATAVTRPPDREVAAAAPSEGGPPASTPLRPASGASPIAVIMPRQVSRREDSPRSTAHVESARTPATTGTSRSGHRPGTSLVSQSGMNDAKRQRPRPVRRLLLAAGCALACLPLGSCGVLLEFGHFHGHRHHHHRGHGHHDRIVVVDRAPCRPRLRARRHR